MEKHKPDEWRRLKNVTRSKMASELDISPVTLDKWEETPSLMPIHIADKYCDILGVNSELVEFYP